MSHSVSVYIPCFNGAETLQACLASLLDQTMQPESILLVDDGSTDESVAIANRMGVAVHNMGANQSLNRARAAGVSASCATWVASVDADVVADPGWLEALLEAAVMGRYDGVGGAMQEGRTEGLGNRWRQLHMTQDWGLQRVEAPPFLYGCNTLYRREALLQVGSYGDFRRNSGEDVYISHRLAEGGFRLCYEPSARCVHLRSDTVSSVLRNHWRWCHPTQRGGRAKRLWRAPFKAFRELKRCLKREWRAGSVITAVVSLGIVPYWVWRALKDPQR